MLLYIFALALGLGLGSHYYLFGNISLPLMNNEVEFIYGGNNSEIDIVFINRGNDHVNYSSMNIHVVNTAVGSSMTIEEFVHFIKKNLDDNNVKSFYLAGHSFGAFLSLKFERVYPSMVKGVVLISPMGMLPTAGKYWAFWGYVYKYFFVWANSELDPGHYIHTEYGNVTWSMPAFNDLFFLYVANKKTMLVYGTEDSIIPSHQGVFLNKKFGFPLVLIDGPFVNESILMDFVMTPMSLNKEVVYKPVDWRDYPSTINPMQTERVIDDLYLKIG